ncbi:hypothetical protein TGRUB_360170 [Toxoplasma gondii RUB]|uniref:Uncharacterized protein n=3 Tax=Toxoplasma gondii TaxID=5811 RepID=A0A086LTC3_TOXGO|nr:hypothetical protein TGFOU_360170 [Toxoplasma gondii FOU]KFG59891.1 hypothetical protein TGRUB_360170 [Toxoplasma gondii RUB]KFH06787.1 hypothetical protein TGVAND_360170 [Toxoplasma gondii VAND]
MALRVAAQNRPTESLPTGLSTSPSFPPDAAEPGARADARVCLREAAPAVSLTLSDFFFSASPPRLLGLSPPRQRLSPSASRTARRCGSSENQANAGSGAAPGALGRNSRVSTGGPQTSRHRPLVQLRGRATELQAQVVD